MYYKQDDSSFASDSTEAYGHFVGISENAGHDMTFKILTSNTNKVFYHSEVRPTDHSISVNLKVEALTVPKVVKPLTDDVGDSSFEELPIIDEDSYTLSPIS